MAGAAWILQHIPEKKREKLGDKLTPNVISVIDSVGAVVGKFGERLRSDGFDDSSTDPECDFKYVKDLALFVNMAALAYKDESIAEQIPFVSKRQLIKDLKIETEVHVCLLEDGSVAFVFRAVASIQAHEGFQLAFQDVTKTSSPKENIRLVAEGLGASTTNVERVICIGHSLGSALATLCAHWCRYVAYPKVEIWCVTFGSPCVGNIAFADDFNENVVTKGRSYCLVNKAHLLPNVPRFDGLLNVFATDTGMWMGLNI
ncbi:hypothetical protein L7F22_007523 [Adiantum nelumboides]|nr:hypothetical protein [Adiantum nelumboides]